MDWQPIDTAPKDGTQILAYGSGCKQNIGWNVPRDLEQMQFVIWWERYGTKRFVDAGNGLFKQEEVVEGRWQPLDPFRQPTHWCHLPPPPE